MLEFSSISGLSDATEVCKIKVRIARVWGFQKPENPGAFTGLNLLLVDEKGDRIQAFLKGNLMSKFEKFLQEGKCRTIMNFELLPNRGSYRGSSHPYKINFLFTTYVKDCEDIPNLPHLYKFPNFSDINAGTLDENVFIDIIGEIVEMKEIKNVTCRGRPSRILTLQLRDLMGSVINVTLWEQFADDIFSYAKSSPSGPIILFGSMMKINLFHGDISIQSSMFATKLFTDPVVKEISEFKAKMSKSTNPEVNLFIPQFTPSSSTQLATETFSLSEQRTIAQISELAKGHMGNVLAMVSSVQSDIPWFYIGCVTCSSKVTPYFNYVTEETEPGTFSCDKCKRDKTTSVTKFKLQVRVVDHTGTASFLLFDNILQKLIQKSVNDLLEDQFEFTRSGHFPQELLDLEGRNFVFKVKHADTTIYKGCA